jgi:hypothetical protein
VLSSSPTLTLHIGLPKTGTTTLQTDFFPHHRGYLGKRFMGSSSAQFWHFMLLYYDEVKDSHQRTFRDYHSTGWAEEARSWWSAVQQEVGADVVISEERLWVWEAGTRGRFSDMPAHHFARSHQHPAVGFVRELRRACGDTVRIRVILTVRNQSDFLGSVYSESAKYIDRPGQRDFEEKSRAILDARDDYLDWASLASAFDDLLGPDNVCIPVFETGIRTVSATIAAFMGATWNPSLALGAHNVSRDGESQWRLKTSKVRSLSRFATNVWPPTKAPAVRARVKAGLGAPDRRLRDLASRLEQRRAPRIQVPEEFRSEVRARLKTSNEALAVRVNQELIALGY